MARTYIKRLLVTSLIAIAVVFGFKTGGVSAASISVVDGSDVVSSNGQCSLSEAIVNVNNQSQVHPDCPAGSGNDVINLPSGTITLQSSLPVITSPVSIVGQGRASSHIDGNGAASALSFQFDVASANFEIKDFSLSNTTSGCIRLAPVGSTYTTYDVTSSLSNLDLTDCGAASIAAIEDGSSGLDVNVSSTSIKYSSVSSITAGLISNATKTDIDGLTVSGSVVGVWFRSSKLQTASYSAKNMTLTSNYLAMGASTSNSSGNNGWGNLNLALTNNTIVGNGTLNSSDGGSDLAWIGSQIYAGGLQWYAGEEGVLTVTLQNNIIANNRIGGDNHLANCSSEPSLVVPSITSLGNNLSDDNCDGVFGGLDQINVSGVSSYLGPLQDNGGGIMTMALLQGSTATDNGAAVDSVITDARGIYRPKGLGYDIGAYELDANSDGGGEDGGGGSVPTPPRTGAAIALGLVMSSVIGGGAYLVISRFRAKPAGSKSEH